jgi:hypothetical protein
MSTPYSEGKEKNSWALVSMFFYLFLFLWFCFLWTCKITCTICSKQKNYTNGTNNDDICKGTNLTFGEDNVDVSFQYLKGRRQKNM